MIEHYLIAQGEIKGCFLFLELTLFVDVVQKKTSYEYKNKSTTNGTQLVPIGIPTV